MVKVYFSSYSKKLEPSAFWGYLNLLPSQLEQKIVRYKRWEDQHASLYGKLLLMKALEEAGLDTDLLNLKYTSYGRPYLESTPDFNIAHSGLFAVCALSFKGKIGVDIEEIKPILIDDFKEEFAAEEWDHITNSNNLNYWFYYYWTAKEAAIKADGRGLSQTLKTINIRNNKAEISNKSWYITSLPIDDNYLLQIATDCTIGEEVELVKVDF